MFLRSPRSEQSPDQELKTELLSVATRVTVVGGIASKFASQVFSVSMMMEQELLEPQSEQAPPHPEMRVTVVSAAKSSSQSFPQDTPCGSLITVPSPVLDLVTVSLRLGGNILLNVAAQLMSRLITKGHDALLLQLAQSPPHPAKKEPSFGLALRVTVRPEL